MHILKTQFKSVKLFNVFFTVLCGQLELPRQLFDLNVFNAWMVLFLSVSERPVPVEGQPMDPELRKSWGWWKVKKWTVHILNRLYSRYVFDINIFLTRKYAWKVYRIFFNRFGDPKLQSPENKPFAQMFQKNYAGRILEGHLNFLNTIRVGGYLPDRVINLLLQYLSNRFVLQSLVDISFMYIHVHIQYPHLANLSIIFSLTL